MENNNLKVGFIGQGWIGKNYADDFEKRGLNVVRYDLDEHHSNLPLLKECQIVFVAVPTPTTPNGFDDKILIEAIKNSTNPGQVVVIKSTIKIGTTNKIQKMFPDRYFIHSPEFLTEATAKADAAHPERNLLGYTKESRRFCPLVRSVLPDASYTKFVPVENAEFVKYMGNCWFYFKIMAMNCFYDIAEEKGLDFNILKEMLSCDSRVGRSHVNPVHQGGRGAGGDCFPKDFVVFKEMYAESTLKSGKERMLLGLEMIKEMEKFNIRLLKETGKSQNTIKEIYGDKLDEFFN